MDSIKAARPDHPVLDCIAQRWSPYSYAPRGVPVHLLASCLEAARWAASSFNEQPWSFLIARREEPTEFQRMLECLVESNQVWAKNAGVLLLTAVARNFTRNGNPNRVAEHDLGLAMGNFCCQATHLGLAVHQMSGIELDKVRATYSIPDSHDPMTGIALGYAADPKSPGAAADPLLPRDLTPRTRKPLSEFVFRGRWSQAADL